jgi:hypothetical protein
MLVAPELASSCSATAEPSLVFSVRARGLTSIVQPLLAILCEYRVISPELSQPPQHPGATVQC